MKVNHKVYLEEYYKNLRSYYNFIRGGQMAFDYIEKKGSAKIKVIGAGGAGGNAINTMINAKLKGAKFIVTNTDVQALDSSQAEVKLQIGKRLTQGLGAGADPNIGREAAKENLDEIKEALEGAHMVFIAAGLGGGTGTGAAPIIAEVCKDFGILTVAVVTKPFSFEGKKKMEKAKEGLKELYSIADTVIVIPNDRLRAGSDEGTRRVMDIFKSADEVLLQCVKGITDLIMKPSLVNLDFADVKAIMQKPGGNALMGIGSEVGENRASAAVEKAICHPFLEDGDISGAKGVLINITSNHDITMDEMTKAADEIHKLAGDEAEIIWGQTFDEEMADAIRVTIIATGIENGNKDNNIERLNQSFDSKQSSVSQNPDRNDDSSEKVTKNQDNIEVDSSYSDNGNHTNFHQDKKAVNDEKTIPGLSTMPFDKDDIETPTFLRRKAN